MSAINDILTSERLKKAYRFAEYAHGSQIRATGEPYISHPLAVAKILKSWGQDETVLVAALLHDTIEDTHVTKEELERHFGSEVAFLVDGVSIVGRVKLRHSRNQVFVENLRKMFVAMAQDIRVVIIRLADRLHNMETLEALPLIKQVRIAQETLEIYAPLAERLGMGQVKGQLEDLAFPYVYPEQHAWLVEAAKTHLKNAHRVGQRAIEFIKKQLSAAEIPAEVHGRVKHKYSMYKKILRPEFNRDIAKLYDLIALRIITPTKPHCYAALGIVHEHFKPAPHFGVSDFIAQPKPNGYQSIHTKVFDKTGRIIEFQIRTRDMHTQAEFGAAAHYAYAEAKAQGASDQVLESGTAFKIDRKMEWVKQLAEWQREIQDSKEFVTSLKLDALSKRIYVFSPLGDVFDLPAGATPIDFAYAVHTDLLGFISTAKVNDRVVTLSYPLQSGDVVEIVKAKKKRLPSRDWFRFVKTSRARARIAKLLGNSYT